MVKYFAAASSRSSRISFSKFPDIVEGALHRRRHRWEGTKSDCTERGCKRAIAGREMTGISVEALPCLCSNLIVGDELGH